MTVTATKLVFTNVTTDLLYSSTRDLTVELRDADDAVATTDSSTVVTFAVSEKSSGNASGTGTATAASGIATKTVTPTRAGAFIVTATASGLTSARQSFIIVSKNRENRGRPFISPPEHLKRPG